MAVSKTDICNKALTLVGASPITSITDNTNNARVLNRVYEIALRSILGECKWNFATTRSTLAVAAVTLNWYDVGEGTVYAKPSNVIRIYGASVQKSRWREEGDYIISDSSELGLRYVYYLDDPTKYPSLFIDAFVDKLASDIAYMIVNSQTLGEKFLVKYRDVSLPNAMAANSQTGIQQEMTDDAWENSKFQNWQPDA